MNIIQFFFLLFMHLAHIFTGFFCPSFSNSTIYCAILFFVTLYLVFSLYFCISPLFRSKIGWEIVVGTSGGNLPPFSKILHFLTTLTQHKNDRYTNIHYSLFLCIKKEGQQQIFVIALLFYLIPCHTLTPLQQKYLSSVGNVCI